MAQNIELTLSAATCLFFFFLGLWTAPAEDSIDHHSPSSSDLAKSWRIDPGSIDQQDVLFRRANAQKELQSTIQSLQNPSSSSCGDARRLRVKSSPPPVGSCSSEQFAREFQYLALSLQVAVATGRMLVLDTTEWKFMATVSPTTTAAARCTEFDMKLHFVDDLDHSFHLRSISCLKQAMISNCTHFVVQEEKSEPQQSRKQSQHLDPSLSFGIISNEEITSSNAMFHAGYYGSRYPVMDMPDWPFPSSTYLIDVVPTWERSFGRFWVRSQMAHYIWEKWHGHKGSLSPSSLSLSSPLSPTIRANKPYIVLYWISCKKLRKNLAIKYGRNATITQDMGRYMSIANGIREHHANRVSLNTIYLLSDGVEAVAPLDAASFEERYPDWKFVYLFPDLMTSDIKGEKRLVGSLEVMRKADFLVGSFQSQVFRLATELNAAWFAAQPQYPPSLQRHWAVDVEWFENP